MLQNVATPISIILTNFKFITKSQMHRKSLNELILFKELRIFSRIWHNKGFWKNCCSSRLYRWIMIEWVVELFRSHVSLTMVCLEYQHHSCPISNDVEILEFEGTIQFDPASFFFIYNFFHKLMVSKLFLKLSYKILMWILLRAWDTNSTQIWYFG